MNHNKKFKEMKKKKKGGTKLNIKLSIITCEQGNKNTISCIHIK